MPPLTNSAAAPAAVLAPVIPLIKRGDLAHYRHLARVADADTLRAVVLIMADDLEEAVAAIEESEIG